jgi:hypothetical protein
MEQDLNLQGAKAFQSAFEKANLQLVHNISQFNAPAEDGSDTDDIEVKDPAIVAQDLAAQTVRWPIINVDLADPEMSIVVSAKAEVSISGAERQGQVHHCDCQRHRRRSHRHRGRQQSSVACVR